MSGASHVMVELEHLSKNFGSELAVSNLNLSVEEGEFVTLLGPSGCGKTTTLRCIAGLERPATGEIRIRGDVVAAPARGIYLFPEQRNIGMVFQSYAIWPHMTVFDNVAYGLRVRHTPASLIKERTTRTLELVGLAHLANRYATKLSGGQRQRVALARAVIYEPRVVLFDEPLSNLDAKLREQMRLELVRLQHEVGITSIYVTHDQAEALVMSDRVVVMDKGVIKQIGNPQAIYARPANTFVANFIGVTNLMQGVLLDRSGDVCDLEIALGEGCAPKRVRATGGKDAVAGQKVMLSVRPEDISIHFGQPNDIAGGNLFDGEVVNVMYLGSLLVCRVKVGCYEVSIQIDHHEQIVPQQKVLLSFCPDHGLCLTE